MIKTISVLSLVKTFFFFLSIYLLVIAACQGWDIVSALGLYMTWICTLEDCVLNRLFPRCHPTPLTPAVYPPPLLHGGYTLREGVWWRHPIYYWVFLVCTHYIVADLSVWTQITYKRTFSWWWVKEYWPVILKNYGGEILLLCDFSRTILSNLP